MPLKRDIENLKFIEYILPNQDRNSQISFIKGYLLGKDDKGFEEQVSLYLNEVYQINIEFNLWIEQLDHYAFECNEYMSLPNALANLLMEMSDFNQSLSSNKDRVEVINWNEQPKGELKKQVQINNDVTIKVGDFVQLGDKIGDDYKKTKFYDASLRNPSWELFCSSEKDFKQVYFYVEDEQGVNFIPFAKVRGIFSNSIIQINAISTYADRTMLYASWFVIIIDKAIDEKEVKVISNNKDNVKTSDLSQLEAHLIRYFEGTGEHVVLEDAISYWCVKYLHCLDKNWHKYDQNRSGNWYEISK